MHGRWMLVMPPKSDIRNRCRRATGPRLPFCWYCSTYGARFSTEVGGSGKSTTFPPAASAPNSYFVSDWRIEGESSAPVPTCLTAFG
jgi:hypothetical protein